DVRIQPLNPLRQTSGRSHQKEKAETLASLSSTDTVSLCLSLCLNIVGSEADQAVETCGQTEPGWVKQTGTKACGLTGRFGFRGGVAAGSTERGFH
ncbi:hypothetical protein KUCAC02_010614, partial [Chaenocephalus aceratus]